MATDTLRGIWWTLVVQNSDGSGIDTDDARAAAGASSDSSSGARTRLNGLIDALVFARIPAFCALVVALASEYPNGRLLALSLGVGSLCLGVAAHTGEILLGRAAAMAADLPARDRHG
jgi:hypothetical protein